jgi:hypothetical protein
LSGNFGRRRKTKRVGELLLNVERNREKDAPRKNQTSAITFLDINKSALRRHPTYIFSIVSIDVLMAIAKKIKV